MAPKKRRKLFLSPNRHLPSDATALEGFNPETTKGGSNATYLATMINPKDHRLYDLVAFNQYVYVLAPADMEDYKNPNTPLVSFGEGYLDNSDERDLKYDGESGDYVRCHTPSGVTKEQSGLGLMLYSGLSMNTILYSPQNLGCFSEDSGPRSKKAEAWWTSQVERGFAEEQEDYREVEGSATFNFDGDDLVNERLEQEFGSLERAAEDGEFGSDMESSNIQDVEMSVENSYLEVYARGTIEAPIQYLPIQKVAESGLLLAWSDEDDDLKTLLEEHWNAPDPELLVELDMSTTASSDLLSTILGIILENEDLPQDKVLAFYDNLPPGLGTPSQAQEILEYLGQQKLPFELVANSRRIARKNPGERPHSHAWKRHFKQFL